MAIITIRTGATGATGVKNAPLSIAEVDQNFINLNTYKVEQDSNGAIIPAATGATGVTGNVRYNPSTKQFEGYGVDGWGGLGGGSWIKVTSNTTTTNGKQYLADTSGGTFTLTLPASPASGYSVGVADGANWATTSLTIGRNGSTIEGAASNLTLNTAGVSVTFVYDGTTWQTFYSGTSASALPKLSPFLFISAL